MPAARKRLCNERFRQALRGVPPNEVTFAHAGARKRLCNERFRQAVRVCRRTK